ncbi:MAG: hypothetical protein ABIH82_05395 [Candidatus Woesearchaeota archaeon]
MGILFKTYNKKHQLHLYKEVWVMENKRQLDEFLSLYTKEEASKLKITPVGNKFEVELNGLIMNCRDSTDLKKKFSILVDMKEKYQKIITIKKVKK